MAIDALAPTVRSIFLLSTAQWLSLPTLIFASGPGPDAGGILEERVDLIELNHLYDDLGRHNFDQVIFYEWSPDFRRFHVIAWFLVENELQRLPFQMAGSQDYCVRWRDRDTKANREVRSKLYRETWSQTDPERANKRLIDEKYRLSLMRPPTRDMR